MVGVVGASFSSLIEVGGGGSVVVFFRRVIICAHANLRGEQDPTPR